MAPELALEALDSARPDAVVLDPMCGSGTVLKHAVERGHDAFGFDLDPMAVLLSRTSCQHIPGSSVLRSAAKLVDQATTCKDPHVPWIDTDAETRDFVNYWFAESQQLALRQLASQLAPRRGPKADALRVALSRTVITKDRGASLARDVSHSRPHKVRHANDYDVFDGFLTAAAHVAKVVDRPVAGTAYVRNHDARRLPTSLASYVDLVITSPPYLNAIDYLRGHRMSLVWLGHQIGSLRKTRGSSIGAERALPLGTKVTVPWQFDADGLPSREAAMLRRFVYDMQQLAVQIERALKPNGSAILVVGDSTVRGVFVENSAIVAAAAQQAGLETVDRRSRPLPAASRYLPPPSQAGNALDKRMRSEVVYHFRKPPRR
jgi:DNA modification methylase